MYRTDDEESGDGNDDHAYDDDGDADGIDYNDGDAVGSHTR